MAVVVMGGWEVRAALAEPAALTAVGGNNSVTSQCPKTLCSGLPREEPS